VTTIFPSSEAEANSSESCLRERELTLPLCYFILYLQLLEGSLLSSSWINTVSSLLELTTLHEIHKIKKIVKIAHTHAH